MIFNTWAYAVFLTGAFAVYWLAPARARGTVLTALGFFFYAYYYPPHVILIAATIPLMTWIGIRVARGPAAGRRGWLALGTSICLGALAFYKYQAFFIEVESDLLRPLGRTFDVHAMELRPPLGISFFVFEYVHYLIESFRGTVAPASVPQLGLFIMFFPTLICGPIKRYNRFHPEEAAARLDPAGVAEGLGRIVIGLAKKTLVADQIAPFCAPILLRPDKYQTLVLWAGVYGYAMQIYFDFAGYSDIAIGSARLFGYQVPENFDYPYLQSNIARFWRAWHMSLTSWITDYVYIPLGGSRRGELRGALNRLTSMTLCGLWHGAAFHFAVWGMYHGIGLNLYRIYTRLRERWFGPKQGEGSLALRVLSGVFTFHFVCIGWVLFVCDLERARVIVARLLLLA